MIIEYNRPDTIDEALRLLSRENPVTYPMGGGTILNRPSDEEFAVVDLQALGLNEIERKGQVLHIGATVKLEQLLHHADIQPVLQNCLKLECTHNLRQMRTVAGTVIAGSGRSPLTTALLALDAQIILEPGGKQISLGNLLPLRKQSIAKSLVIECSIPLNTALSYQYVARTPADLPIVCVAAARWQSGRIRIALGGYGETPVLAMDGSEFAGAREAVTIVFNQAEDEWASAEYRQDIAVTLAQRCLVELSNGA